MTDRELLEMAAKAAGIELNWFFEPLDDANSPAGWFASIVESHLVWNPLADDGDALRLAVKLRLYVRCTANTARVRCQDMADGVMEPCGTDPYAATRRAIVRAAAEIGRTM